MPGKKWSSTEELRFIEMRNSGVSLAECAKELGKTYNSVERKSRSLPNLPKNHKRDIALKDMPLIIADALREAIKDIPPYEVKETKSKSIGDTLVIHLTDLHAGKIVKNELGETIFDEGVFTSRMNQFCTQILKLLDLNISKGVPITDVVILSTGDLANGEGIYATQVYEQEVGPPKQCMLVVETFIKLIKSLLDRGLPVRFEGVKGNHGRLSKEAAPENNWDLMIYLILDFWAKTVLKDPKFKLRYAETDYMTVDIQGHKYVIRHIAPESSDTPSGRVKFNQWARQYKAGAIVYGHYHHFGLSDVDGVRVFRGGSLVGGDSLSESMSKNSEPIQLVWGVNSERVSTFFYAVDLRSK